MRRLCLGLFLTLTLTAFQVLGHGSHGDHVHTVRGKIPLTSLGLVCEPKLSATPHPGQPEDEVWTGIARDLEALAENLPDAMERRQLKAWKRGIQRLKSEALDTGFKDRVRRSPELQVLVDRWAGALAELPALRFAWDALAPVEKAAYAETLAAAISAVTTHPLAWVRSKPKELDVPRIRHVLDQIRDFQKEAPAFAFYKIRRAIEGRYSLAEFVNCRSRPHPK